MGFKKSPLPDQLPDEILEKINELKNISVSPDDFLKRAYEFLGDKYRSERFNTILKFNYLFKPLQEIWDMHGYIPCTQSSFLMRIFLIRSGFFKEEDIKIKHTFVNFCIHQYLQAHVGDKWIDIDVGEKQKGMEIGKHLKNFG
ncbi:MAG: hypothetical protein V1860_00590 [bacterium]